MDVHSKTVLTACSGGISITQRERFLKYMSFQQVDRVPLMDMGVWPETLTRWHGEGLPPWVTKVRHLEDYLGLDLSFNVNWLPIQQEIFPPFEREVLDEDDETVTLRDETGTVLKEKKRFKSIPHFIKFPVATEEDYEKLKTSLNGKDQARYPDNFDEDLKWRRWRNEIVGINFRSFFGFPRKIMGLENWCTTFYDNPGLVERMIFDRLEFAKDLFTRVLQTGAVDFVQIWEDMAFKTAPLLSPELVRQYMLPAYKSLVDFFRSYGVKLIMVDSDGHVLDLIPIWIEAGIDGCHPCEIAAGSDPCVIRADYPKVALIGGVDKRKIARGKEGVDAELERLMPVIRQGAYIPMIDHFVPPDISYETFLYYIEKRQVMFSNS